MNRCVYLHKPMGIVFCKSLFPCLLGDSDSVSHLEVLWRLSVGPVASVCNASNIVNSLSRSSVYVSLTVLFNRPARHPSFPLTTFPGGEGCIEWRINGPDKHTIGEVALDSPLREAMVPVSSEPQKRLNSTWSIHWSSAKCTTFWFIGIHIKGH